MLKKDCDNNPFLYATSLKALQSLSNLEFVSCCYQTLLQRSASTDELAEQVNLLNQGTPRMELILQLIESSEGRQVAFPLPGLKVGIKRYRNTRIPVIGWILRYYYRIAPAPRITRNEHQIIRLTPWGQDLLRRIDAASEKHRAGKGGHQCA